MWSSLFRSKAPAQHAATEAPSASLVSKKYEATPQGSNSVSTFSGEGSASSSQPSASQHNNGVLLLAIATLKNKSSYASMCAKQDHAVMLKIVNAIILVSKLGKDSERQEAREMAKRLFKDGEENAWLQEELELLSANSSELNKIVTALQDKPLEISIPGMVHEGQEPSPSDIKLAFKG